MTVLGKIRAISLPIFVAAFASLAAATAGAQSPSYMRLTAAEAAQNTPVYLGIDKSVVIDLPRAAGDVLVSNPQIADAVLRTSSRLYLIGVALGQASVFLFDSTGAQIASFDVYVEADLSSLNQLLAEAITSGYVRAEALQGSIVLRGQVASATDAGRAVEITQSMIARSPLSVSTGSQSGTGGATTGTSTTSSYAAGSGPGIVNLLSITGEEQVALKVTIAEVQREVVKQLGINLAGSLTEGNFNFGTLAGGLSPIPFGPGGVDFDWSNGTGESVSATLRALDETNMSRILAEPTLTAVSGETADFLAGGEFPFVTGIDADTGIRTIEFRQFGVQLAFTPVVLSGGRISLRVRTEVSEIVDLTEGTPILGSRRAETTVELPSGGAFVIAGLVQQNTRRAVTGFPGLQKLPILGALFSSRDFLDRETELVMIVTPYLVKPVAPQNLARPDQSFIAASDAEAYFLNRLSKVYGTEGQVPAGSSSAQVGFTFD